MEREAVGKAAQVGPMRGVSVAKAVVAGVSVPMTPSSGLQGQVAGWDGNVGDV